MMTYEDDDTTVAINEPYFHQTNLDHPDKMRSYCSLLLPALASGFVIPHGAAPQTNPSGLMPLLAEPDSGDANDDNSGGGLILDAAAMAQQMAGLKSKYPTAEADYLAAARARAAQRAESKNNEATDDDWKQVKEKTKIKDDDDWEISAKEAGNIDSQILIPLMNDDDEEPKLMLF